MIKILEGVIQLVLVQIRILFVQEEILLMLLSVYVLQDFHI